MSVLIPLIKFDTPRNFLLFFFLYPSTQLFILFYYFSKYSFNFILYTNLFYRPPPYTQHHLSPFTIPLQIHDMLHSCLLPEPYLYILLATFRKSIKYYFGIILAKRLLQPPRHQNHHIRSLHLMFLLSLSLSLLRLFSLWPFRTIVEVKRIMLIPLNYSSLKFESTLMDRASNAS